MRQGRDQDIGKHQGGGRQGVTKHRIFQQQESQNEAKVSFTLYDVSQNEKKTHIPSFRDHLRQILKSNKSHIKWKFEAPKLLADI